MRATAEPPSPAIAASPPPLVSSAPGVVGQPKTTLPVPPPTDVASNEAVKDAAESTGYTPTNGQVPQIFDPLVSPASDQPGGGWFGTIADGGVDLNGGNGLICSGALSNAAKKLPKNSRVNLACSDGRLATLTSTGDAWVIKLDGETHSVRHSD